MNPNIFGRFKSKEFTNILLGSSTYIPQKFLIKKVFISGTILPEKTKINIETDKKITERCLSYISKKIDLEAHQVFIANSVVVNYQDNTSEMSPFYIKISPHTKQAELKVYYL